MASETPIPDDGSDGSDESDGNHGSHGGQGGHESRVDRDDRDGRDDQRGTNAVEALSTGGYLRLVFGDRLSVAGVCLVALGAIVALVSTPAGSASGPAIEPLIAGGAMVCGAFVFALGYTRAQHALRDRERERTETKTDAER